LRPERLLAALLVVCLSGAATAQSEDAVQRAREHYRRGEAAYAAERFDDAYREFEEGYALAPKPAFLLNMAHSERRRGQLRNARALYLKYLLVEPQSKYREEVEQVTAELERAIAAEDAARIAAAGQLPVSPPPIALTAPPMPPPPAEPRHSRLWIWAAVGGVVLAGAAAAFFLTRDSYQKSGSLGTLGHR
jgi:tetratricopeptide (TPR) repeat protein